MPFSSGRVVHLRIEEVTLPNGTQVTLEIIRHPGAAAVVPVDADGHVTLIRQFRHAAGGFIWEIPAGKLDGNEDPADCAARELREETGLTANEWTPLGSIFTAPGFCDERIFLFLARGLSAGEAQLGHDEVLTVSRVPFPDALAMIDRGDIQDAKTIAGLHQSSRYLLPPPTGLDS